MQHLCSFLRYPSPAKEAVESALTSRLGMVSVCLQGWLICGLHIRVVEETLAGQANTEITL
jgi:hypothetical protein